MSNRWTSFDLEYWNTYILVSQGSTRYKQNKDYVQETLSNKNQVKSFSFSLSETFHPNISTILSYKSTDSPSVVLKSSLVGAPTDGQSDGGHPTDGRRADYKS